MIIDKINKAADILQITPNLQRADSHKNLFGVIHDGSITAMPIEHSTLAPIDKKLLMISPYPEFAAAISMNGDSPVWIYDTIQSIKHMQLPKINGPDWVMLVAPKSDLIVANTLADRWASHCEVSVMMDEENKLLATFAANYKQAV